MSVSDDWQQQPGESKADRDARVKEAEEEKRRIAEAMKNWPKPDPTPRPAGPFYPPPKLPSSKHEGALLLAFVLSIIPWILLLVLELGSGMQYLRFALFFLLIFGVAYAISRLFLAVWKPLLLVSLAGGAYYVYSLWSAKPEAVPPPSTKSKLAAPKSSKGPRLPR